MRNGPAREEDDATADADEQDHEHRHQGPRARIVQVAVPGIMSFPQISLLMDSSILRLRRAMG